MKVFIYTSVHKWNDSRIFHKEIRSIAKEHQVEFHAPADFKFKKFDNVKVYGLPNWKTRKDRIKTILIILGRLLRSKADIYHFHDPELIITAFIPFIKKKKVIFDVHENISKQIKSKENLSSWKKKVYSSLYKWTEKIFHKTISHYILAEKSYEPLYEEDRRTTIYNFPIVQKVPEKEIQTGKIVYVGNWIQVERGALELIKAVIKLKEQNIDFELFWIGEFQKGSSLQLEIETLIKHSGIEDSVKFLGRMDYNLLFDVIAGSNIGYSCLHRVGNFLESYPTKIFEYMMCGVPVVCSDFPLWKEIVDGAKCGECADPLDTEKIVTAFKKLIDDQTMAAEMGRNGKRAVDSSYNWQQEENKLLQLYREIL